MSSKPQSEVETPSNPTTQISSSNNNNSLGQEDALSELPSSAQPETEKKQTNVSDVTASQKVDQKVVILALIEQELDEEKKRKEATLSFSQNALDGQKNLAKTLSQRISIAVGTTQKLYIYFQERANIAQTFAKSIRSLPNITESGEVGTVEMGLDYLHRIANSEAENYQQLYQVLQDQICKNLYNLLQELQQAQKKLNNQFSNLNKNIESLIEKINKNFNAFESGLRETSQTLSAQKDISKDPFLNKIQYYDSIKNLNSTQRDFSKQLETSFQELEILDKKRISTLKAIIQESISLQKTCALKIVKDMDVARDTVQTMSGNDWNIFCIQLGISPQGSNEPLLMRFQEVTPKKFIDSSFVNVFKTRSIIKFGELELSGMLKWTKYSFILTKYGFLHYFSQGQSLEPAGSIALCYCTLDLTQPSKNLFNLVSSPPGFFSSSKTYSLRCPNEEAMVDWAVAIKQFIKK